MKYPLDHPFSLSIAEAITLAQTDGVGGISDQEAARRLKLYGANIYKSQTQKNWLLILLAQFNSAIVYLLVAGAVVSLYFNDVLEAISILAVIVINALIGFLMEMQGRRSMDALKKMEVIQSKVVRNGQAMLLPAECLVPGDLVKIDAGDVVPADGRLIWVSHLQCDEAALTGESFPAHKSTDALPYDTAITGRHNMVFKGTSVINGNAKMVVTGVGINTELGAITSMVDSAAGTQSPLDQKLTDLTHTLIGVTLVMTAVFVVTGLLQGKAVLPIIETAIALAVAAIPEGLPIVATMALSYGMLLMARRNAIVKNLSAVETLGSTSVILTDKTGTLTENKILLDTLAFPDENIKVHIANNLLKFQGGAIRVSKPNFEELLLTGILCNNAANNGGDPLEVALLEAAVAAGCDIKNLAGKYHRVAEIPFSSDLMMMGTLHRTSRGYFAAVKGSVERVLEKCTKIRSGNHIHKLDGEAKQALLVKAERMAADGLRVLAFASREDGLIDSKNYLQDLVYIGMGGFADPPRTDIKGAIFICRLAGIKVVMITGDHPQTALHIGKKVGLIGEDDGAVINGIDLPESGRLTKSWKERILATTVFARVSPRQKLQIAEVFQQSGAIIAMTGDGVNDAPALKQADVGIAMGLRGTQVAKEAASIVLKDDSFTSIAGAVAHGREIFQNIQKFVVYLVSCNLSEVLVVTLLGFIMPGATLLPMQILFLNMVTDVFPALALGLGTGDATVMLRPPRDTKKKMITKQRWLTIAFYAFVITAAVIITALYGRRILLANERVCNNMAFITLTFAQLFHVFNMASKGSGMLNNEITRNAWVWAAILVCSTLMAGVFLIPQLRLVLGLSVLKLINWLVAIAAGLLPLVVFQLYKLLINPKLQQKS